MKNKIMIGVVTGTLLGALDGLSAWFVPEARTMLLTIVVGSMIKGLITGALAGWVATRWRSMLLGVGVGLVAGFGLSSLAAIGQTGHYWDIVLPGMLVGIGVGVLTQRYPRTTAAP